MTDEQRGERASERRAILWGGAVFAAVAVGGLVLAPSLSVLWLVLLFFAITAVPQAFMRRSGHGRKRQPRR